MFGQKDRKFMTERLVPGTEKQKGHKVKKQIGHYSPYEIHAMLIRNRNEKDIEW